MMVCHWPTVLHCGKDQEAAQAAHRVMKENEPIAIMNLIHNFPLRAAAAMTGDAPCK
jgi:hypothetical protein